MDSVKKGIIDTYFDLRHMEIQLGSHLRKRGVYLGKYSYKKLQDYKSIHLNERCFIVATGPS